MLAGLAVSVIATVDLALPAYITAALIAATLVPILSFKETGGKSPATSNPAAQEEEKERTPQGEEEHPPTPYSQIVKQALATLREHVTLRWAIAYLVILSCVAFYAEVFLQPYTLSVGLPIIALGAVMVAVQAMSIAGSLAVPRAQKTLGTDRLLYAVPLLLIPCLLLLGAAPLPPVLLVAAISAFLFALTEPVLLAVIQRRVPDHARATVLSIKSLFATIFLTLTEPALGLLSDTYGVHTAYLGMAALIALFSLTLLLKGRRWVSTHSPT
jgi:Na+/melibiose symporter-like transporter